MSELPAGVTPASLPEPRDSSSAVVLRPAAAGGVEVLMGLRSRESRFMPGHLSFPGGTLDDVDRPADPGAFVRCVRRELVEEAGLAISVGDWIEAGERITPPLFPVRFRTRFFVATLDGESAAARPSPASAENESMQFLRAATVLAQWADGSSRVPPPLLPLLRELARDKSGDPRELARRFAAANAEEERAPRIEFVPDVWMLPVKTETMPPATHTNVWMPGGRRFVIIDPGSPDAAEQERLRQVVERRRQLGQEPSAVVLTHEHQDHVSGAAPLARALGLPILAHERTLRSLGHAWTGIEQHALADGAQLDLDGLRLQALFTPGHAPGHLAFLVEPGRWLIGGDLVSGLSTILIDPDQGEMRAYLDSLARVSELGVRMVFPGHGPPLPARALSRMIEHRERREQRVLRQVGAAPRAIEQIARRAYAELPHLPTALTVAQTLSHLVHLEKRGRVRRQDAEGRRWHLPAASGADTAARITARLSRRFRPAKLELRDDSAAHAGHAGALTGGGHYQVTIVAAEFEGKSLVEQHRMVYEALGEMMGHEIHALALKTAATSEAESEA